VLAHDLSPQRLPHGVRRRQLRGVARGVHRLRTGPERPVDRGIAAPWGEPMKELLLAMVITTMVVGVPQVSATARTSVSIDGDKFEINGAHTNLGRPNVEGRLLNARMINAAFNDRNATNRLTAWTYPDTGVWDA